MWRRHPSAAGFTHNYAAQRRDQQRILDRGETAARTACDRNETTKVLVLEFSTPLSVLRVYPDTLTVERVLSIEFINCAPALGPRGLGSARAVRGSAAPPGARPSVRARGSRRPALRCVSRVSFSRAPAAWRIRSAPAAGALRTRGRPRRPPCPEPRRAPALACPADYPGLRRPFRTGPIAGSPPV